MPSSSEALQRVSPAALLPAVLAELKIDPAPIFEGLSFSRDDLVPSARLPFAEAAVMLERASRAAGQSELGVRVGVRNDYRCLGLVGELMAAAPDLGRALTDYVGVHGGMSQAASSYLIPMGDSVALGFGIYDRQMTGAEQVYGMAMGAGVSLIRTLTDGAAEPTEVQFSFRPPPNPAIVAALLRTEVRFNQPQTCVVIPRGALTAPCVASDPRRLAELGAVVSTALGLDQLSTAARLRHILRPALSFGETSLAAAAQRLSMSGRSLDRRLAAEGTSFARERDSVRFVMASELLALTDLPVGDVAAALSYSSHSAFVRSFRRWSGCSPSAWRLRNPV